MSIYGLEALRHLRERQQARATSLDRPPSLLEQIPPDAPMEDALITVWNGERFIAWEDWLTTAPAEVAEPEQEEALVPPRATCMSADCGGHPGVACARRRALVDVRGWPEGRESKKGLCFAVHGTRDPDGGSLVRYAGRGLAQGGEARWTTEAMTETNSDVARPARYFRTFTGRRVHSLSPSPDEIDIDDIAHSLAYQCRFLGHTTGSIPWRSIRSW